MEKNRVCPWWLGYFFINPMRKLNENPEKMFASFVKPGMWVVDYGCAMGYFSLPLAQMTGDSGKVYCYDIQRKMLDRLVKRARKRALHQIIIPRMIVPGQNSFEDMEEKVDFVLLNAVAHEVPDQKKLFRDLHFMLKPGSLLYFSEPPGHVKPKAFRHSVDWAKEAGFEPEKSRKMRKNTIVLRKPLVSG
ncbi:MAG: class I SAM-dependent methyltransferase [Draconibacterium sp.]